MLHTELDVWKVARTLARRVYALTAEFPGFERHALGDQIRRAAVSVAANIAEGSARGSRREFARSLRIARGSLAELHSHISIAVDVGYVENTKVIHDEITRVSHMLNALIGSLSREQLVNGTAIGRRSL